MHCLSSSCRRHRNKPQLLQLYRAEGLRRMSKMEFEKRKADTLAAINSPEPDKSPKGNIDTPIIPLLNALNSHPSYFTTSSCSGRISIFSQPTIPSPSSKKKAKGGTWLFISHDYPVDPNSVVSLLFPSSYDSQSPSSFERQEPESFTGPHALVFRFEPLIIAVECRDIEAAQSLVSLAISCGFRESGITSASKRVIIAIRCSIRLEVPLGDTENILVSAGYVKYLVELANEKMEANRKRTDNFLDALLKNGFFRHPNSGVGSDEELGRVSSGKLESSEKSSNNNGYNEKDRARRDLDDCQSGSSVAPRMKLLMSSIQTVGEPAERLFLWGHSASAVGSTDNKKIFIFGGFGGIGRHGRRNELLLLDPESWKIEAVNVLKAPSSRLGHTSTIVEDSMYVIGGRNGPLNILNDVWVFRVGTGEWSLLHCTGTILSPRHRHAAAAVGSRIYIFGGIYNDTISSSLYVFDTQNLGWSEINSTRDWPSPRHSHSLLAHGTNLYMFGGYNGEKALGDFYTFNIQTCEWKKVKMQGRAPPARFSHSMFLYNNYICIIGGCPVNQHHNELSLFDLQSCSWNHVRVDSIGSDLFVRSTANVIGDELIMIGGGASCYAFGTKFSEPIKINLLPLMTLGDNTSIMEKEKIHTHYHRNGSVHHCTDDSHFSNGQLRHESPNCCIGIGDSDVNAAHQTAASYWILRLERKHGKLAKDILKKFGWLDLERKVCLQEDGRYICFPILECFCPLYNQKRNNVDTASEMLVNPQHVQYEGLNLKDISDSVALNLLIGCGAIILSDDVVKVKKTAISPLKLLKEAISSLIEQRRLPLHLVDELPSRWDKLGDIIVLPVSSFKDQAWEIVEEDLWPIVAQSLGTRCLARQGRIAPNGTRDSTLEILVGDSGWVEHRENGILYSFDATKCMFSWGNLSEKLRMSRLDCKNEVIVDLFAGIGYFTLPFLVRAKAKLVYACEWNPHAVEALRRNVCANSVADQCIILEGDNRITAPIGVADRVCLGLLPTSEGSWITAIRALRNNGGMLHVHGNVKDSEECSWKEHVSRSIHDIARTEGRFWEVSVVHIERVKWYAPHIRHLVADVLCRKLY